MLALGLHWNSHTPSASRDFLSSSRIDGASKMLMRPSPIRAKYMSSCDHRKGGGGPSLDTLSGYSANALSKFPVGTWYTLTAAGSSGFSLLVIR